MKGVWLFFVFSCMFLFLQAGTYRKREVSRPCFITTNTSKIEIKKIILTDEQTQVDAVLYGEPGEAAVISSKTCLRTTQQEFSLREAEGVSIDGKTEPELISKSGKHHVTLSFAPIPAGVHAVDFVEKEEGWIIWGVQLSKAEPYVYIPSFLQTNHLEQSQDLPAPQLKAGKSIINGYILGYDPQIALDVVFRHSDWLFYNDWGKTVKVRQDGSFHIETDLLLAGGAKLQINKAQLDLFLLPGKEMTVYIHLPRLSMSASRLLKDEYGQKQKAWFDGAESLLNTELATWGYPLALNDDPDFSSKTLDLSDEEYNKQVQSELERLESDLDHDQRAGKAYKEYVSANMQINALVLQGARAKMQGIVDSPYDKYGYDYVTYLQYRERDTGETLDLWEDIKKARNIYQNVVKEERLKSADKKMLASIEHPEISAYVREKIKTMQAVAERAKASEKYVIAELDTLVSGADILPAIISQHQGNAVLVDFWTTWCGPCRKSMPAVNVLKQRMSSKDVVYVYVTGPSSPKEVWKTAIAEINGIHYRLTQKQWEYLCNSYGITGIPGYLVISYDGKLQDRYVGFPGVDILQRDLLRAME
ncbi:TlpA family protein disulfide reductase [Phocaeicola coprocola]|uniref:TlpA family protein disulfide reductase n=1 Tax=Phocaeicola coprocola TaxID=310298 RepID=UPI00266FB9AF|nr:thioredoxin-like domain-containing protein [Phocaeicola coprocola]